MRSMAVGVGSAFSWPPSIIATMVVGGDRVVRRASGAANRHALCDRPAWCRSVLNQQYRSRSRADAGWPVRDVSGQQRNGAFCAAARRAQGTSLATGEIRAPFVSPDGRWVGFTDGASTLNKVAIAGGPVATIATTEGSNARGTTWLQDDTVIFATALREQAYNGSPQAAVTVTVLTRPDHTVGEIDHWWPEALPDGQTILYTITTSGNTDTRKDCGAGPCNRNVQGRRARREPRHVCPDGPFALHRRWDRARRRVRFDADGNASTAVPVVTGAVATSYRAANMTVAGATGTLVYADAPGAAVAAGSRSLVWVDRQGGEEPVAAPPRAYVYPRLSPDGTRVALSAADQEQDIWSWDLKQRTLTRFTFDPAFDSFPEWTPDGRQLFFESRRTGVGRSTSKPPTAQGSSSV